MKDYRSAKKSAEVPEGESMRILRELQELIHRQRSALAGSPPATISAALLPNSIRRT